MKKFIVFLVLLVFIICLFPTKSTTKVDASQQSIASKIIRFHVIANSDTTADQALKLKVRDGILAYLTPKLNNSKDISESREIIKDNNSQVLKICSKIISDNGYSYKVNSTLGKDGFPVKSYGNLTLPQGTYEAYRVIIGSGQGKNWWCVMFPPLCFIDLSKGQVSEDASDNKMKKVLTKNEYNLIDSSNTDKDTKIHFRFKFIDVLKTYFK